MTRLIKIPTSPPAARVTLVILVRLVLPGKGTIVSAEEPSPHSRGWGGPFYSRLLGDFCNVRAVIEYFSGLAQMLTSLLELRNNAAKSSLSEPDVLKGLSEHATRATSTFDSVGCSDKYERARNA